MQSAQIAGQLLYYTGEDNIVFGSDSLWYGGPQWQIDALWRFQIPDQIQEKWRHPSLDNRAKRKILGLNSARQYGLRLSARQPVGAYGSFYKQGSLADCASFTQPGTPIDNVLQDPVTRNRSCRPACFPRTISQR
jgi:hypothetical protein